jgi:DNA-binding response OmpR family regulator
MPLHLPHARCQGGRSTRLRFGEFVLDCENRLLLRRGTLVILDRKVFDCLELLVSRAGRLTTSERLYSRLWPDVHVGPGALRKIINAVRKTLGDRLSQPGEDLRNCMADACAAKLIPPGQFDLAVTVGPCVQRCGSVCSF